MVSSRNPPRWPEQKGDSWLPQRNPAPPSATSLVCFSGGPSPWGGRVVTSSCCSPPISLATRGKAKGQQKPQNRISSVSSGHVPTLRQTQWPGDRHSALIGQAWVKCSPGIWTVVQACEVHRPTKGNWAAVTEEAGVDGHAKAGVCPPPPWGSDTCCFMGLWAAMGGLLRLGTLPAELADACLEPRAQVAPHICVCAAQPAHRPDPWPPPPLSSCPTLLCPRGRPLRLPLSAPCSLLATGDRLGPLLPACLTCLGVATAHSGNSSGGPLPCPA